MLEIQPMETLRNLSVEEQDKVVKQAAATETSAIAATNTHKSLFGYFGKVVCMLEERLNFLKADRNADGTPKKRLIASNTSLSSFWESITKVKGANGKPRKLNSHWYSCAVAFGTYVRSELITEADYDKNTAQCLELAASISTEAGGDVNHEAVIQAAEELRDRNKKSASNLRDILESLKEPKAMTVEQAQKALDKIMGSGLLCTVIAAVGAEIAHTDNSELARSAFFGMNTANDMFEANVIETTVDGVKTVTRRFSDEVLNGWSNAYQAAHQNPTPEPTPAPAPAPDETSDEETASALAASAA